SDFQKVCAFLKPDLTRSLLSKALHTQQKELAQGIIEGNKGRDISHNLLFRELTASNVPLALELTDIVPRDALINIVRYAVRTDKILLEKIIERVSKRGIVFDTISGLKTAENTFIDLLQKKHSLPQSDKEVCKFLTTLLQENPKDFNKVCSFLDSDYFYPLLAYAVHTNQTELTQKMLLQPEGIPRNPKRAFTECLQLNVSTALNLIDILPKGKIEDILYYVVRNDLNLLEKVIEKTVKRNFTFDHIEYLEDYEVKAIELVQEKYKNPDLWQSSIYSTFMSDKGMWWKVCRTLPLAISHELIQYAAKNSSQSEAVKGYIEKMKVVEGALLSEKENMKQIASILKDMEGITQQDFGFTSHQLYSYLIAHHQNNPVFANRLFLGSILQQFINIEETLKTTGTRLNEIKEKRQQLAEEQRLLNRDEPRFLEIIVEEDELLSEEQKLSWSHENLKLQLLQKAHSVTLPLIKDFGIKRENLQGFISYKELFGSSKELFEDFISNLCYSIDTSHYAKGVQKIAFPQGRPVETKIYQLLNLFDEPNFYDPSKPDYLNPRTVLADDFNWSAINQKLQEVEARPNSSETEKNTAKKEILRSELRSSLETLVERIVGRVSYTAVPKDKETFYKNIENAFCHVIHKFNQEKGTPGSHRARSNFILECIRASAHCAQPVFDLAVASYSERILGLSQDFGPQILRELGLYREFICSSVLTPQSKESINYQMRLRLALGEEFGIPGYQALKGSGVITFNAGGDFDAERDRARFLATYTPKNIFNWINDYTHATSETKEKCKEWYIEQLFPEYDTNHPAIKTELEPLRLHAMDKIADMEKKNTPFDDIANTLLNDEKIPEFVVNMPREIATAVDRATEKSSDKIKMQIGLWRDPPRKTGLEILDILAKQYGVDVESAKMQFLEKEAEKQGSDLHEKFMTLRPHTSADDLAEELGIFFPIRQLVQQVTPVSLKTQVGKWLNNTREPETWIVAELAKAPYNIHIDLDKEKKEALLRAVDASYGETKRKQLFLKETFFADADGLKIQPEAIYKILIKLNVLTPTVS
ncbi:MAG: hypothetical protein JWO53_942, partial [Chlamydiia bacterium]|nr:hypothetical protein [Chlamydiia bacterium]